MPLNSIISPAEIERINILKDKHAVDKYGKKAINGVIEIKTKNNEGPKKIPISGIPENNRNNNATIVKYNGGQDWLMATYSTETNPTELFPIMRPGINSEQEEAQQNKIFTKVEFEPEFPGGDSAWKNYLEKNVKAEMPIREGWKPGVHKIVLTFIVKSDGTITDIKSDNYAGSKTAEHCVDLIKKGPGWKPAVQNGQAVNCYRKQPVTFVVPLDDIFLKDVIYPLRPLLKY